MKSNQYSAKYPWSVVVFPYSEERDWDDVILCDSAAPAC